MPTNKAINDNKKHNSNCNLDVGPKDPAKMATGESKITTTTKAAQT